MVNQQPGSMANLLKTLTMTHTATHSKMPIANETNPLSSYFSLIVAVLILAILIMTSPTQAAFTASVDRTIIASHESIELTLRTDQDSSAAPDLKSLEWNFDILGTRQSRQVRIINGRSESFRDWIVTLMPKQTGTLVIPPLSLGSEKSEPITISVRKNLNDGSGSQTSPVFMKAAVSSESIYVQQELILTLQILYRVPLYDENRLSPLEIDDAIIQQLGETRKYDTVIEGTRYSVFELKYAIHPQKIGPMDIPSLNFSGVIAENRDPFGSLFSSGGKPIVARSPHITIEVKPQPDTYPNQTWLPARNLDITETWSQSLDNLKVGDAITRTITVEADGLGAAQLPPVLMPQPEGVNSYPDRSNTKDMPGADGIRGQRTDSIAMIPTRPGTIHLPAVSVTWFDTESGELREASIPEKTITVLPAENQQPPIAPPVATTQTGAGAPHVECPEPLTSGSLESAPSSTLWQLLTALFALLWLVSTALWLREKRQTPSLSVTPEPSPTSGKAVKPNASSEAKAFANLESACKGGNIREALEQLKAWSRLYLKDNGLITQTQCLDKLGSDELKLLCNELNRSLYSGESSSVELNTLLDLCRTLRTGKKPDNKRHGLTDLYPSKG